MDSIIQWNCRGFRANFDEIGVLSSTQKANIFCLQETYLKPSDSLQLRNYHMYNAYGHIVHERAFGGSSILVKKGIIHSPVHLITDLQAVAVRVTLHRTFTICSLYIPPNRNVTNNELTDLFYQLPTPCLILGDFNGHNPLWGSSQTNNMGNVIEEFLNSHDLCIFNDGSYTYLHPGHGTFSSIDLSICDSNLFLDFAWSVLEDSHGSDHFPIVLEFLDKPPEPPVKWKFSKADWDTFSDICTKTITCNRYNASDSPIESFTEDLIDISNKTIPRSKTNPVHAPKPWFDSEVKQAISERRRALRQLNSHPTSANLNNFKILRARARRIIRQKKRFTWRTFVSHLNSHTPSSKVWKMLKKIQGKSTSNIQHLEDGDEEFTTHDQIANRLGQQFSFNSSTDNCTTEFKLFKTKAEKVHYNFASDNSEDYNAPLTLEELESAIQKATDSATGPDEIHYQLLKHLPKTSIMALLSIFNEIWATGNFPLSWKSATIIPIPKPDKDHTNPTNYRPIALTSCLCKTLERIVNNRLTWYLESSELLTNFQSGFRANRSTTDHLVSLETYVRNAFICKEHVVAIFFDLEKAYDTTWKFGIMKDLFDFGLRGRLPIFIDSFLKNRSFKVQVGSTLSDSFVQEMGVPQGSVLSPTCFNIKINSIAKAIRENTMCSLYVDDFLIAYKSKHMPTIERQLQLSLNRLQKWSHENGFKFSKTKTVCVHFCQLRSLHPHPDLVMDGAKIQTVDQHKFLGVLFDSKLSFIPHIKTLKAKALKSLNLMKVVSKLGWGGDSTVLLRLYRATVRSKLDYGSIVYGSARPSYLRCLNTVHHQGIRLSLGAFRTSPIESMLVLAKEPSLTLRRIKLSLQYTTKLAACPTNSTYDMVFTPDFVARYESRPAAIRPLGLRISTYLNILGFEGDHIFELRVPDFPSWVLPSPEINFQLAELKKSSTNPITFQEMFNTIRLRYHSHKFLYTDGSKDGSRTAFAVTSCKTNYCSERLPDVCSVYTAELTAIHKATDLASDSNTTKFMICSDSKSALQALANKRVEHPIIRRILMSLMMAEDKEILYCWIPGHVDIDGNEKADFFAKKALSKAITQHPIPHSDFKQTISDFIFDGWQTQWNECENNKLHAILPIIKHNLLLKPKSRKDETVIHRCLIGHTRLTHRHLLVAERAPTCNKCQAPLTVKHILLECNNSNRHLYFQSNSMKHLFTSVPVNNILRFLHASGYYNHI